MVTNKQNQSKELKTQLDKKDKRVKDNDSSVNNRGNNLNINNNIYKDKNTNKNKINKMKTADKNTNNSQNKIKDINIKNIDPSQLIAVIRIRGQSGITRDIKDTLKMLSLYKPNYCTLINKRDNSLMGMVMKVKDYVTWGEIDNETFKMLIEKRGEKYSGRTSDSKGKIKYNKFIVYNNEMYKKFFRLHPPIAGYERKGIKTPYSMGGALGYRKDKINDLIRRMI